MNAPAEIKIKGNTFHSVLKSLESWKGVETGERVRAAFGGEAGQALRMGTLMSQNWYPVAWYRELYSVILQTVGGGEDTVRHLGRASTAMDMNGVYRLIMKALSVHRVFSQSTRMLAQYYTDVQCVVTETRPLFARASYSGFHGFNRVLWVELRASTDMVLESAGARRVQQVLVRGGAEASSDMELELSWE